MTPEQVLDHAPLVLDQRARAKYFDDGFLTLPGYVGPAWLDRLRAVVAETIMEPYPARLPPRWDQVGYRSIFAAQSRSPQPARME